jgi:hypothetical protein
MSQQPVEIESSFNLEVDAAQHQMLSHLAAAPTDLVEDMRLIANSGALTRNMVAEVQASVDRVNAWLGGHGLQIVLQGCNNLGGGDCFFYTVCRKLGFGEDHVAVRKAAVEYAMQPTVSSQGSTVPWIVAQKGEETVIDWLSQYEQLRLHDNVLDALDAWAPLMIQPGFFADEIVITAAAHARLVRCVVLRKQQRRRSGRDRSLKLRRGECESRHPAGVLPEGSALFPALAQ